VANDLAMQQAAARLQRMGVPPTIENVNRLLATVSGGGGSFEASQDSGQTVPPRGNAAPVAPVEGPAPTGETMEMLFANSMPGQRPGGGMEEQFAGSVPSQRPDSAGDSKQAMLSGIPLDIADDVADEGRMGDQPPQPNGGLSFSGAKNTLSFSPEQQQGRTGFDPLGGSTNPPPMEVLMQLMDQLFGGGGTPQR